MTQCQPAPRRSVTLLLLLLLAACSACLTHEQETVPPASAGPEREVSLEAPSPDPEQPLSEDELYAEVPAWQVLMDEAHPDDAAVEALASWGEDVEMQLALGTWCGDSRAHVPRLLKALSLAENPHLKLSMTALARGFRDRPGFAVDYAITRVPTLIVFREGEEIGRYVETPIGDSIEADLVAILKQGAR